MKILSLNKYVLASALIITTLTCVKGMTRNVQYMDHTGHASQTMGQLAPATEAQAPLAPRGGIRANYPRQTTRRNLGMSTAVLTPVPEEVEEETIEESWMPE